MNFIRKIEHWPIAAILIAVLILFVRNYIPGTFLTGWDNLHPEFNFAANIQRSIFAVWQEYQGLGLLGGMAHASDLIRQLFLLVLSIFLPESFLRYLWVFITLFIGGSGAYFLSHFLLEKLDSTRNNIKLYALTAGLFYIFNLATIQTFHVPFEAFIAHFAFLPWLILSSLSYVLGTGRKSLLFLSIVLLIATPAAYIPTLFVVYILSISILIAAYLPFNPSKDLLGKTGKLFGIIILVNAFWLLPFLFFTVTSAGVNIDSKINQMATETIFLQNKEFGNITDVILLKGFWFNNVDPNFQGLFTYMLNPWRDHLAKPIVQIVGYLLFFIVFLGLLKGFISKKPIVFAFCALFLFSFTMLATATPPFSWLNEVFRIIPLFNQAFRFPFTKFSTLTGLSYSIFFSFGLYLISEFLIKKIKLKYLPFITSGLAILCLIILTFPAFRLDFFYHKERLIIPKAYFDTFEFFKKQDPNTRIANLPQQSMWGWNFYSWGYGGSGFPWYGIKQPILDRAFDVWSKYDENYYWELTEALYSKDPKQFEDVLNKYQITWLMVDKSIVNPASSKALFIPEFEGIAAQIPAIKKREEFGNLSIYEVALKDKPDNYVFDTGELLGINGYNWTNDDRAYASFENYITSEKDFSYAYPFRSLFSGKNQSDQEYTAKEGVQTIEFKTELPKLSENTDLLIPPFSETETSIPADIIVEKNSDGTSTLFAHVKMPEISITRRADGKEEKIWEYSKKHTLAVLSQSITLPLKININGVANFEIKTLEKNKYLGSTFFLLNQSNIVTIKDAKLPAENINLDGGEISAPLKSLSRVIKVSNIEKGDLIKISTIKVNDNFSSFESWPSEKMKSQVGSCSTFRRGDINSNLGDGNKTLDLYSENATACLSFHIPSLDHSKSYVSFIQNKNISGRPFHFWILNEDQQYAPVDTFFDQNKSMKPSYFLVPPQEYFGTGYSIHLENISIGKETTENQIGKVGMFPVPYRLITSLVLESKGEKPSTQASDFVKRVTHPNESLYIVEIDPSKAENKTLILSQGYDKGWSAFQIKGKPNFLHIALPFIFGKGIDNHVKVNNWENGWEMKNIDQQKDHLIIVYIPQYLQYLGFILTLAALMLVLGKSLRNRKRNLTDRNISDKLSESFQSAPNEQIVPRN